MNGKINVLYVHRWGRVMGGAEVWLEALCKHLDQEHFKPHVALHYREALANTLIAQSVPVHVLPINHIQVRPLVHGMCSLLHVLQSGLGLFKLTKCVNAQIIHAFSLEALQASLLAARLGRIPTIVSVLNSGPFTLEDKATLRLVNATIVNARSILQDIRATGIRDTEVHVIRQGIDTERFATASGMGVRKELGLETKIPIIGMIGNIEHRKGYDILIRAASEVVKQFPEVRFVIVGADHSPNGQDTAKLQAFANELGVAKHFIFMGARRDIPEILAAMDIFVLCSRAEGLSVAMVEAMVAGRPVIVTSVGGTAEAVEHTRNGLLIPPEDPIALAEGLHDLLGHPEKATQMGKYGQAMARQRFETNVLVRRTEDIYRKLLVCK